jgi:micrococcal nuclease
MRRFLWFMAFASVVGVLASPREGVRDGRRDCDPSYPDVCLPSPPPDLDCADVPYRSFRVVGRDPHGFDADHDGIGCEPYEPAVRGRRR